MKYKCENCGKKVFWEANGGHHRRESLGQQFIDGTKYKIEELGGGKVKINGEESWSSSIFLIPRNFYCYNCSRNEETPHLLHKH